jgi:hypothetical protein
MTNEWNEGVNECYRELKMANVSAQFRQMRFSFELGLQFLKWANWVSLEWVIEVAKKHEEWECSVVWSEELVQRGGKRTDHGRGISQRGWTPDQVNRQ